MRSTIVLQDGPIGEVGVNGDQIEDILGFVINKLKELNQPPLDNEETAHAITHCEEAYHWLMARRAERVFREVEGTAQP